MQDSKYQRWYAAIIDAARDRDIPRAYTEVHHIKPRSLGGGNEPGNLVRLTYREHFLVHWLLTRFCVGGDLRRMQRALFAMTLTMSGGRIVAGWQFDAAKRAIRDLELDPVAEARWREAYDAQRLRQDLRDKAVDQFSRGGKTEERRQNLELVDRLVRDRKLNRSNINTAATLLLRHSGGKKGRFRKLGLTKSEVNNRILMKWRAIKNDPNAKAVRARLQAALRPPTDRGVESSTIGVPGAELDAWGRA